MRSFCQICSLCWIPGLSYVEFHMAVNGFVLCRLHRPSSRLYTGLNNIMGICRAALWQWLDNGGGTPGTPSAALSQLPVHEEPIIPLKTHQYPQKQPFKSEKMFCCWTTMMAGMPSNLLRVGRCFVKWAKPGGGDWRLENKTSQSDLARRLENCAI